MKKMFVFFALLSCMFGHAKSQDTNINIENITTNLIFSDGISPENFKHNLQEGLDFNLENYLPQFYETRKKIKSKDIFKYLGKALTAITSVIFSSGSAKEAAIAGLIQTACEIGADATSKESEKRSTTEEENKKLYTLATKTLELLSDGQHLDALNNLSEFKNLKSQEEQYRFIVGLELDVSKLKKFVVEILYSLFWILIK